MTDTDCCERERVPGNLSCNDYPRLSTIMDNGHHWSDWSPNQAIPQHGGGSQTPPNATSWNHSFGGLSKLVSTKTTRQHWVLYARQPTTSCSVGSQRAHVIHFIDSCHQRMSLHTICDQEPTNTSFPDKRDSLVACNYLIRMLYK